METSEKPPLQLPQVFINFRGAELRHSFISHLHEALQRHGVNVYVDGEESRGKTLESLFKGIEGSQMALVILSKRYTESSWCLDELVKIKERAEEGKLVVVPIFYRLDPSEVKGLDGDFGNNFCNVVKSTSDFDKLKKWKEALDFVSRKKGMVSSEHYINEFEFISDIVDHVKRGLKYYKELQEADSVQAEVKFPGKLKKDDIFLGEENSDATSNMQNSVENKRVDSVSEENKQGKVSKSSTMVTYNEYSPQYQVFISFRGDELRHRFVSHLHEALKRHGVNVYVDGEESRGKALETLFKGIEDSQMALVIFSKSYTESSWCLDELVKIKERAEEGKLVVVPIFYRLNPSEMKRLDGDFGINLWNLVKHNSDFDKLKKWKEALDFVSQKIGMVLYENNSNEITSVSDIVNHVKRELKSDVDPKEADSVQTELKLPGKLRKDDSFLGEENSDATSNMQDSVENKRVDSVDEYSPQYQVFINFRGEEVRRGFVSHLIMALRSEGVNVYVDGDMRMGEDLRSVLKGIEDSRIALVIFSSRYGESAWCLDELVKIKEQMEKRKLIVIPVFYKVDPLEVKLLKGDFGVKFWNSWRIKRDNHIIKWKEALMSVALLNGIYLEEHGSESDTVKEVVQEILLEKGKITTEFPIGKGDKHESYLKKPHLFGMEQRMEELETKLEFDIKKTRIIGVVGMHGIGKTTLAKMLHEKWSSKFIRSAPLMGIHMMSKEKKPEWLRKTLLEVLLGGNFLAIKEDTTHESLKVELFKTKIFAVLDDVSDKEQLDVLLGDCNWIKKGSKIVITTCDKSLLKGFADDTYVVPELNDREAFQLFSYHAFNDKISSSTGKFLTLSRMFVDYAQGNPLVLNVLGRELCGKDKAHWEHKLETMATSSHKNLQDVCRFSIDQLNEGQKEVFLDIMRFFKSEDEYLVRSLLDSGDPDSIDTLSEVRDLANKFLIMISAGRVEMNEMFCTFGKDLSSQWLRLWNYKDIINKLKKMKKSGSNDVRGIFLDMSEATKNIVLERMTFTNMRSLRYLKIYNSSCPRQCKANSKLQFPDGFEFPLEEIRYLDWMQFPLEKLPPDFRTENLVDLRLPYSKIERVWEGLKDTPQLKWVDLHHSSKLFDLSALSKADNLQRLNLEGCTVLKELPMEIENMKSLVFMNLRGCMRLWSLPKMNLISLKTLILSDCSNLKEFQLISESIEVLHLDGTMIKGLPLAIRSLKRLVVLNLKNCKMLEYLPNCLGELKALEELILSGCSSLKNLPDIRESMKHLQCLLIDMIGAKEMPNISCITLSEGQASADMVLQPFGPSGWPLGVNGVSSLRRLSLSGNDFISLQTDIWKLYNLSWLDLNDCKMLKSIPMLPPRLQYFDAHGCESLQKVANPLALPVLSEQIHATFNFSNCNKLDQDAKDRIVSYTQWKSQLVLDAHSRYNGGSVLEDLTAICFPGWEVPSWFNHQVSGSVLNTKLHPHWCDNKLTGMAMCAVILLPQNYEQKNNLFVKCNCVFNNEDESFIRFSCTIGSWSKRSNTPWKIEQPHVFIGYSSILDIKKHNEEEDEEGCSHTEALFEFQVTDGTNVLEGCEVLKCGFSLVYATDERENTFRNANTVVISDRTENVPSEEKSYGNSISHDGFQYESCFGLTLGRAEKFFTEETFDVTPNLQKGSELKGSHELQRARQSFNMKRSDACGFSIDQLNKRQKDVFLDIMYFFKSEDENFVRSILDSRNPEGVSEVRDLADKFLITISSGRVELQDQLYILSKDRSFLGRRKLWNYKDINSKLTKMKQKEANNVRGIFLDMSEIMENIALECITFTDMRNLLYLKIYDSSCPRQFSDNCNLYFPDGLEFQLEEIRYLHWVKYPLEELPSDFKPKNLVDLRLPYSKINRIWEGVKDTPWLNSVDLSHSSELLDLSALSNAESLQRLNLEGCTSLDELPIEIRNMKSLIFLNLRGCIRLLCLLDMNLNSLKILILSDCSNLKEFQLNSKSLEFLHLDGTAIKGLPHTIESLQRLVVLNLKNCKMLECLPSCLSELKYLEELILSGCSRLENIPNLRESMKHLQILLLDGIGVTETPSISCLTRFDDSRDTLSQPFGSYSSVREWACGINGVSSLERLCLSGNDFVSLHPDIAKLCHLKWLDVKQCKKLRFVPMLPPRLQYFDAHGCESLERVANPLALPVLSGQIHATFNFSHCNKLDQDAKSNIMSYTRWRSQLVLDEFTRYKMGFALEPSTGTCFPGWEVPTWFSHRASGSVLEGKLLPYWCANRFTGIALCAVVVFHGYHDQRKRVLVKCNCEFKNEGGSSIQFSCSVGGWSKPSNSLRKIESTHVFISYASKLDINILSEEDDKEGCSHTEASFEFQVTDGTNVLEGCEVLKCGFSFLYATDELQVEPGMRGAPAEPDYFRAYSKNYVAASNVRGDTKTAERLPDGGGEIVELQKEIIASGIANTPQPPLTKSIVPAPEYGTGLNKLRREIHVQASDASTSLSKKLQHLSTKPISVVASSSVQAELEQSDTQVLVSFHGAKLGRTFVRNLVNTLTTAGINVFTEDEKGIDLKLEKSYKKIEESKIALVIFSKTFMMSTFCLNELVMMDKLAKEGKLLVIPVFYDVISSNVKYLEGEFGKRFKEMKEKYKDEPEKVLKWETSVKSIAKNIGIHRTIDGNDAELVEATVNAVQIGLKEGNIDSLQTREYMDLGVAVIVVFILYLATMFPVGMVFVVLLFWLSLWCVRNQRPATRTNNPVVVTHRNTIRSEQRIMSPIGAPLRRRSNLPLSKPEPES